MTVCLVIPPSPFLLDQKVFMSLGVLRVAAILEQAGVSVSVCDLSGSPTSDIATAPEADVYGLTVTSPQLPAAVDIIRRLRQQHPTAKIILGGPHVTLMHAAKDRPRGQAAFLKTVALADVAVAGDGERAIFEALKPSAPRFINADAPREGVLFLRSADLNHLPFPARHLIDVGSYHYTIDGRPALSLIGQLGCPFGCNFCGGRNSSAFRRIRTRTTENVLHEVSSLYLQYGISGFMFYDDELNVSPSIVELMDGLAVLGQELCGGFALRGFIKAELFTEQQAAAMVRAGFKEILVGFESGSDRILENIQKKATKAQNTRCIQIARDHGLRVKSLMSLGHPGESAETIQETYDWLVTVRPDDFDVTIISVYPGTNYYDHAVSTGDQWTFTAKNGDRLHSTDVDFFTTEAFYKGVPGNYEAHTSTDYLTSEQLVHQRDAFEAAARQALGVAYPTAVHFDHSMGQA